MAAVPLAGALVIAIWFGAYALVFGVMLLVLGFRLRTWERALPTHGGSVPLPRTDRRAIRIPAAACLPCVRPGRSSAARPGRAPV